MSREGEGVMTLNEVLKQNEEAANGTSYPKMAAAMYTLQAWFDDHEDHDVTTEDFVGLGGEFLHGILRSFMFATKHILDRDAK